MSVPVREGPVSQMASVVTDIEKLVAQGRVDHQLALVREHWPSVRRLWLNDSELAPGAKIRSELPPEFWIGCGMPGIAPINPTDDGRFEFTEDGLTAIIIPAYDTIPDNLDANPAAHVQHLRDLVAVDLYHPNRHWRRRGKALILGNAFLEIAGQEGEPVPVFKTPMSWLMSGGAGIAILDWNWTRKLLLDHELIAEDVELGTRLESALGPEIWVMRTAA